MADIQTEIDKLVNKIRNAPIPEKVLTSQAPEPKPVCPRCNGLGFLRRDLPREDPEFGKLIPCNCSAEQIYGEHSGLSLNEIRMLTWAHILDHGEALKARQAVQRTIERGYGWVYLWGGPGVAKTLLLKIAVAETIKKHKPAGYVGMSALLDNLREAYDVDQHTQIEAGRRLKRWASIPMLAIDEFDKVKDTDFVHEKRMRLLDDRYEAAVKRQSVTLIASNLSPEVFEDYLADRIRDGRFEIVELTTDSLRPAMDWAHDL